MLELLDVEEGDRVLDVGAGSGWTTAILARLCGPSGSVVGVERVPALVEFAAANVAEAGMPWARVAPTRRSSGPDSGPYDRILVSAEPDTLPEELVDQLAPGGVMVIPVGGRMLRVRKTPDGVRVQEQGHYRFVPWWAAVTTSPRAGDQPSGRRPARGPGWAGAGGDPREAHHVASRPGPRRERRVRQR